MIMNASSSQTDKGLGLALLFGSLALVGAIVMLVGAPDVTAAWGFAGAMLFGTLAVISIHVFG